MEAGATAAFVSARENGDASYSGAKAISMYYNEGRNEVATDDYVVPYATGLISQGMAMFAIGQAAEYIATQSGNATAMANLAKAPQTIAAPVGFTSNNLRPYKCVFSHFNFNQGNRLILYDFSATPSLARS